ncbi:MAG TPA: glycoside hydrolase family 97 protein [Bacteroidales bacterium]|nr:glycoside hydrolase family 97 protein [Bacteroidales bacterium]
MENDKILGICLIILTLFSNVITCFSKTFSVESPNKRVVLQIDVTERITYSLSFDRKTVLTNSPVSLQLRNQKIMGIQPVLIRTKKIRKDDIIYPVVREKRKMVRNRCNEIQMSFQNNYGLIFRVYDDGMAYRFLTTLKEEVYIMHEEATFSFADNHDIYFPEEESFMSHSERSYPRMKIGDIRTDQMCCMPVLIELTNGLKAALLEVDLDNYAGMYLQRNSMDNYTLYGKFPAYPLKEKLERDRDLTVTERADYIARTDGNRLYPWRVVLVSENEGHFIESDMIFRLAKPLELDDVSWIRPGKVAWDWWNALNLYGIDFTAGINTQTYKYYIDFASKHNIEYIILDEGWSDTRDLLKVNPDLQMEELISYANQKNVGVILWCLSATLDGQLEEALNQFQKWGIKGIKVDFMQRDDQKMVRFYHKVVKEAAKRQMLVDFHGAYKPTGLRCAYPNLITREGVKGLEWSKWSNDVTPEHDVIIPFTRMLAGPMDFTPGAMLNANKDQFHPVFNRPMSQGTRVHQLAMYIVYESPLQMLSDSPSNYMREPDMMKYLSEVPTVWDETIVPIADAGEHLVIARQSGDDWYIGAMTDWSPKKLTLPCTFLGDGTFNAVFYEDGLNVATYASDYIIRKLEMDKNSTVEINMAGGGGWVAVLKKKN